MYGTRGWGGLRGSGVVGAGGVVMDCCAVIWVGWVEVLDLAWRLGGERG